MSERSERIAAIQHLLASIFASQRALKTLAPEFKWAGLGNLLGDFGELVAIDRFGLKKAPPGSDGFDALTPDGLRVQIKANYAASMIGFRGTPDLMLVISVQDDGSWSELYFGPFDPIKAAARHSARDNKSTVSISKLKQIAAQQAKRPDYPLEKS